MTVWRGHNQSFLRRAPLKRFGLSLWLLASMAAYGLGELNDNPRDLLQNHSCCYRDVLALASVSADCACKLILVHRYVSWCRVPAT